MINQVFNQDCLEGMKAIPSKSIDMILCDLPYGTTACKWDVIIPFAPLWEQYERVVKDNGAIVLTASQPFTTDLIQSNRRLFKYELIWDKGIGVDFQLCNVKPMKSHENIIVFGKSRTIYNPQMEPRQRIIDTSKWKFNNEKNNQGTFNSKRERKVYTNKYPLSILDFSSRADECNRRDLHPTQKPVALFEYLIKTYTNEGETVLDNCMGSGTTAIACINTGRNYIGFEKDAKYYEIIQERIKNHKPQLKLAI